MPAKSEKQRRYIFYLRNKYKDKAHTPKKDKWIWDSGFEKVEESWRMKSFSEIMNYEESLFDVSKDKFRNIWKNIKQETFDRIKNEWQHFKSFIKSQGLEDDVVEIFNRNLHTNFVSFNDIPDATETILTEDIINEDFKHWWEKIKTELFPALAFYPALNVWLELDKVIKSRQITTENIYIMMIYGIFWVVLVSFKYTREWYNWKKNNPAEYAGEKMMKRLAKKEKKLHR